MRSRWGGNGVAPSGELVEPAAGGRRARGTTRGRTIRSSSRRAAGRGRWAAGPAAVLLAAALVLLPLRLALAQGNPALLIRQLQARVTSLSRMAQRLNEQLTAERQMRLRQEASAPLLQRLQSAVNAAAAAGDPTAQAARSPSAPALLQNLTAQFEARARLAREAKDGTAARAAELAPSDLAGARLAGAGLRGAKLAHANLSGADLRNADLTHAALPGANLQGARLQGAILTGADLTDADLKDALYDLHTRWPDGYDPQKKGALLVK